MMPPIRRAQGPLRAGVLGLLALATACAPRAVVLPEPGAPPTYPEFTFPEPPPDLGSAAALERHRAGWLWLQAGDFRAAERNFNSALKLTPGFFPAHTGLGYVELARKDFSGAVEQFDRAVAASTRYAPALLGRGEALLALGRRDAALASFESAVAADPELTSLRSRIEVLRFRGLQEDVAKARTAAEDGRLAEARALYDQALASSPQSPFLYREIAAVERRQDEFTAALTHVKRAIELDPADARSYVLLGEIHEAQGRTAEAVEAYDAAVAIEPSEAIESKIDALRRELLLAAMPPEFQSIDSSPTISRAQLAALFGARLDDLLKRAPRRQAVLITDTRGSWAAPWILSVTRAGVMEVYANHTFQPTAPIRRADLAHAASRVLTLIAAEKPQLGASWLEARRSFPDVLPGHLSYPAASVSVEAGVMAPLEDGSFALARPVTGPEALAAVKKLEELAESGTR